MNEVPHKRLVDKIKAIPPERLAEIELYVDFILSRSREDMARSDFLRGSEEALRRIWDNDDDSLYDTQ
jgi:hypothetical protein